MANEIFESIRHTDEKGNEYWLACDLVSAIGYKDYRNFKSVVAKAICLCKDNNANEADHFVECTEMVKVGSGAMREQNKYSVVRKDWITADDVLSDIDGQRKDFCLTGQTESLRRIRQVQGDTRPIVYVGL